MATDDKTTAIAANTDGQWLIPTGSLPAHYCVACHQLCVGTDYYWRSKLNGLISEYVHPACLREKPDA